jgi:hypothetical protein
MCIMVGGVPRPAAHRPLPARLSVARANSMPTARAPGFRLQRARGDKCNDNTSGLAGTLSAGVRAPPAAPAPRRQALRVIHQGTDALFGAGLPASHASMTPTPTTQQCPQGLTVLRSREPADPSGQGRPSGRQPPHSWRKAPVARPFCRHETGSCSF